MLINRDHRPWLVAVVAATVVAGALHLAATTWWPSTRGGGSALGLTFGILGTLLLVAAALLPARKRYRTARIGSARTWMSLHIWAGVLCVPLLLLHSGFSLGGPLTTTLMTLFFVVVASGVYGLILQQFLPRLMTERLGTETVYGQIDHVRARLSVDAYELVAAVTGPVQEAIDEHRWLEQEKSAGWKQVDRRNAATTPAAGSVVLRAAYLQQIRPYLRSPAATPLPDFAALLQAAPAETHACIQRLHELCEESGQLLLQRRMHGWLHGWLFVHAPLSLTLLVLAAIHIAVAVAY